MKRLRFFCYGFLTLGLPVHAAKPTNSSEHSIVCIESILNDGQELMGTGFFIAPGIIATVQHQVKNAKTIVVHIHDQTAENAKLMLEKRGLAILAIANKTAPYLSLDNTIPAINTPVFTSGCQPNKQHVYSQLEPVQQGAVSDPKRADSGMLLIEASLPIKKGNSGGPLLLDNQQVAGIVNGYDENQPELSVSIPASVLIQLMAQQQVIAFAPEITVLWEKAQASHDKAEQLQLYGKIIEKTPWHTEAHFNQGIIYFTQHDYLHAKAQFQLVTQQRPNFYNAYIYLGLSLSELKDFTAARDNLIQAILLGPKNPLAYSLIAGIYQHGLADAISERNALQHYVTVETNQNKVDIAKRRLQEIEQSFKP